MEIVIETPRDSREKYDFDPKTGHLLLKKVLPLGMAFPYDFGFIPSTMGEDGGPLDALVFSEFKTFPGCRLECRLIGALKAEQQDEKKWIRNDRFFFVPACSIIYQHLQSMKDFPAQHNEELLFFFMAYNQVEGKKFRPIKMVTAKSARKILEKQ